MSAIDNLDGGFGNDDLDGGDDRDTLDGGLGTDIIDGGVASSNGFFTADTVLYDRVSPVQVDLRRTDASQGAISGEENDKIVRVENATGGDGDDTLTGDEKNNILQGARGNDVLKGEAGRDALHGLEGADTLIPSPLGLFGFPVTDGQPDILNCGDDVDNAFLVLADSDLFNKCESVLGV